MPTRGRAERIEGRSFGSTGRSRPLNQPSYVFSTPTLPTTTDWYPTVWANRSPNGYVRCQPYSSSTRVERARIAPSVLTISPRGRLNERR